MKNITGNANHIFGLLRQHILRHKAVYAAIALTLALGLGYMGKLIITRNFHEVVAGELYRSAQPTASALADYQKKYGIRTVINLRGTHANSKWYREEKAANAALGITQIDLHMSSRHELTETQSLELINTMRHAQKPILIHCQAGANRTSLAVALYMAAIRKENEFNSELQLSMLYGHVSLWFTPSYAMDRSFEKMEPVFGYDTL